MSFGVPSAAHPLVARHRGRRRGSVAAAFAAAATAIVLLGFPATAAAEAPTRLPGQITDSAGVLDDDQRADVEAAANALFDEHHVQLWVVYVDSFDGLDADTWASRTEQLSGLGGETALLSVATGDRAYAFTVPSGITNVSGSEIAGIERDAIVPALRSDDWAGAAVAAAGGLSDAISPGRSGSGVTYLVIGGGAVVLVGGAVLYSRRRTKSAAGGRVPVDVDWTDAAVVATLPVATLDARAKQILVDTDNAVRTSAEELALARGEFGDAATAPFTAAHDRARAALGSAFTIRQRLDDDIPETPDQQRDLLVELITACSRADRELDEKVREFDGMRDLLIDAPARLDELTRRVVESTVRLPRSEEIMSGLGAEFPAPALASVSGNIALAREQVAFAEHNVTAGRDAVALPVGQQGPAVAAIRAAEAALDQVRDLLDAVDHAAENIRVAAATLPAALDDARTDIAAADALAAHGGTDLASAQDAVRAAVAHAEASGAGDPLGALTVLTRADAALDAVLATASEAKAQAERTAERLTQAITVAQAQVTAAGDYVGTRRGAVDTEARTRISEAQRHLDAARELSGSDPTRALEHARAATDLAGRALQSAQADVQRWEADRQTRSSGSNTGAVLGGILIDSMLRGGAGGGRGHRGGGGRSPGSFGGSGSSGRISRSGRF